MTFNLDAEPPEDMNREDFGGDPIRVGAVAVAALVACFVLVTIVIGATYLSANDTVLDLSVAASILASGKQ